MSDLISAFEEIHRALAEARAEIAKMRAAQDRMFRVGKVTDVDAEKHLYRQEIGVDDQGNPVKGPWRPYSQQAGARKSHSPPSVGQQFMMISPGGDFERGLGVPHGWSNDNPSPSTKGDEDVDQRGSTKDTTRGDSRTIDAETLNLNGTVKITGELIVNGIVFSTHKHKDVLIGPNNTGLPTN